MDKNQEDPVERALVLMRRAAEILDANLITKVPDHLRLAIEVAEEARIRRNPIVSDEKAS